MAYIDYFVIPVPAKKVDAYKVHAKQWAKHWKKLGVVSYTEAIADDVKPGKVTSFPQSVQLKKGEVVFVGAMVFKTRKHRDSVWKKAMASPEMAEAMNMKDMPFDGKRMYFGGFKQVVGF
jgi:uncharacterized protein YbaA (DUF1428 family)